MHATKSPGDRIDHGTRVTRYAMIGDTYMSGREIDERANALDAAARGSYLGVQVFPQIAVALGLARPGVSVAEACMILAAADVTWSDICWMKS